jgi:ATP-dependent protease HslVU (ClpYQ) peptidase subunit
MAYDSQITFYTTGDTNKRTTVNKVVRKGEILIGMTGNDRDLNIVRYRFEPPVDKRETPDQYIFVDFLDAFVNIFEKNKRLTTVDGVSSIKETEFLIAYKGAFYSIESDLCVTQYKDNFNSIGSGYRYALGALEILNEMKIPPEEKLMRALEVASKYDMYCKGPFKIIVI